MPENLVIPPMPDDRKGKYEWITKMVDLGFTVKRACELAGVPTVSYFKIGRKGQKPQELAKDQQEGAA